MDTNFSKFKKKVFIESIIKNCLISLSLGILSFSILFLLDKLEIISLDILISVLIGVGVLFASFIVLFFILKPKNMNVAKRIDNQFNLNEKVQTMIAFEGHDGDIISLQREDAKERLSKLNIKSFSMKFNFLHLIIPVIALALCVTSITIPASAKSNINEEKPPVIYDEDDVEWYLIKIQNLIEYVNSSEIADDLKADYVAELNLLIDNIEASDRVQSVIYDAAVAAVTQIKIITDIENSNNEIAAIIRPDAFDANIVSFSQNLIDLDIDTITEILNNMRSTLQVQYDPQNPDGQEEALQKFYSTMVSRIRESDKVSNDDPLYIALKNLGDALLKCNNATSVHPAIQEAFNEYDDEIILEIMKQKKVQDVNDYVVLELSLLFDIEEESGPIIDDNIIDNTDESLSFDETTESDTNPNNNQGGMGTGDVLMGSDELVFDPEEGSTKYQNVIDDYYKNIMAKFDEGLIDEKYRELVEKYYNELYGAAENNE